MAHLRHPQSNLTPVDRYYMDDSPDISSVLLLPDQNGSEALHVRRHHPKGLLFGNLIGTSTRPDGSDVLQFDVTNPRRLLRCLQLSTGSSL